MLVSDAEKAVSDLLVWNPKTGFLATRLVSNLYHDWISQISLESKSSRSCYVDSYIDIGRTGGWAELVFGIKGCTVSENNYNVSVSVIHAIKDHQFVPFLYCRHMMFGMSSGNYVVLSFLASECISIIVSMLNTRYELYLSCAILMTESS